MDCSCSLDMIGYQPSGTLGKGLGWGPWGTNNPQVRHYATITNAWVSLAFLFLVRQNTLQTKTKNPISTIETSDATVESPSCRNEARKRSETNWTNLAGGRQYAGTVKRLLLRPKMSLDSERGPTGSLQQCQCECQPTQSHPGEELRYCRPEILRWTAIG